MWDKIYFNKQNIERETDKAVLIKMPNKSAYSGWMFWHPAKLVREEGGNGYHLSFSFSDSWEFKVFKPYKKGKNPEKTLFPNDMKEIFMEMDEVVGSKADHDQSSYLEVTEPEPVNKEVEVDESLKR